MTSVTRSGQHNSSRRVSQPAGNFKLEELSHSPIRRQSTTSIKRQEHQNVSMTGVPKINQDLEIMKIRSVDKETVRDDSRNCILIQLMKVFTNLE